MAEKLAIFDKEQTIKDLQDVNKEVDVSVGKFNELVKVVTVASYGFNKGKPKEFTEAITKTSDAISKLKKEFDLLAEVEKKQAQLSNRMAIAESESGKEIALKTERVNALAKSNREWAKTQVANENLSNKERASLGQLVGLYDKVQKKLEEKRNSYRNLAVAKELGITLNDKEERTMARLEKSIQKYDKALKTTDATMGIHRRNVGNYASRFNALNNSVAQLTREAPAFTYSLQTGFMAISNNFPILFDAIKKARVENSKLNEDGKKGVPVWKQLSSAFFSWNTLLSVGITLLTVYGEDFYKWGKQILNISTRINVLKDSTKALNEARQEANKNASSEIVNMQLSYKIIKDETVARADRLSEAKKLQDMYPNIFKNMTTEQMLTQNTTKQYNQLKDAILASAYAEAIKNKVAEATAKQLDKEQELLDKIGQSKIKINKLETGTQNEQIMMSGGTGGVGVNINSTRDQIRWENENLDKLRKMRRTNESDFNTYTNRLLNIAEKYQVKSKVKSKVLEKPEKIKDTPTLSKEQKDFLASLQAQRDEQLADKKFHQLDGLIDETKYQEERIKIVKSYAQKVSNYLKGKNGRQRQIEASVKLRAINDLESSYKEIFDFENKKLEENSKMRINKIEEASKKIENNQYITDYERLQQQIKQDDLLIAEITNSYNEQIKLAEKYKQDTLELQRKRDEDLNKAQDRRSSNMGALPGAMSNEIDRLSEIQSNLQNKDYEQVRLEILKQRIPQKDKDYLLSRLELENNIKNLEIEKQRLLNQKEQLDNAIATRGLTIEEQLRYTQIELSLAGINSQLKDSSNNIDKLDFKRISDGFAPLVDMVTNGLNDLGLNNIADQFSNMYQRILEDGKNFKITTEDIMKSAGAIIADFANQWVDAQKQSTINALDEQLAYTQSTTEQELEFINQRLERLNALDELNAEQIAQRNQLEDEARTLKEQQAQREKQIEAQKARAEQKAAAQQALINGALAATMTLAQMGFIAGAIPAALALGFGIAQSIAIMTKDPVPKYRVGRQRGKAEYAITQDGGREMITDKKGNIKSLGSDKGDQLTWLDKDDKVYTASETKRILKNLGGIPNLGENIYHKLAKNNFTAPTLVYNQKTDNSDYIADKMGQKFDNALRRYTHDTIIKMDGKIYVQRGANHKQQIGYYDLTTGVETYY